MPDLRLRDSEDLRGEIGETAGGGVAAAGAQRAIVRSVKRLQRDGGDSRGGWAMGSR